MDAATWIGLTISFLAVIVAVVLPLLIERAKWPELRLGRADDANARHLSPVARFVHVRVTNQPLRGLRARWLQRNTANACKVEITFRSKSSGDVISMPGRWSATPQPLTLGIFDNEKLPQSLRFDLPPDEQGEVVAVAIKRDGNSDAFGFTSYSYADPAMCLPTYALPDEEYEVEIRAHAGPVEARRTFVLKNTGTTHRGLQLSD